MAEQLLWEISSPGMTQLFCFPICRGKRKKFQTGPLKVNMWRNLRHTVDCCRSHACPEPVKGNAPLWVLCSMGWTNAHRERSDYKTTPASEEGDRLKDLSRPPPTSLFNKGTLIQRQQNKSVMTIYRRPC